MKRIDKIKENFTFRNYYNAESFERDAKRYIKAAKEGRLIATIPAVYNKGMARDIKIIELQKFDSEHLMPLQFNALFDFLGYRQGKKDRDAISIKGTGQDMLFSLNYDIIQELKQFGFIKKESAAKLAQKRPTLI